MNNSFIEHLFFVLLKEELTVFTCMKQPIVPALQKNNQLHSHHSNGTTNYSIFPCLMNLNDIMFPIA